MGRGLWPPRTARRPAGRGPLLGHLASTGRPIATVQQARSAISHFHAAAGKGKGDNPTLHPVVSEAVKGWRNRAPAPRQAGALAADVLIRVREVLRLPKRGRGGRMESADTARRRAALDLAIIGVLADGGLRRSEAAALRDIRLDDVDFVAPVFGLTGATLANRVRTAGRRSGRRVQWPQRPHRDGAPDGGGGSAQRRGAAPGPVETRRYGGPLYAGRGGRGGGEVAVLTTPHLPAEITQFAMNWGRAGGFR